MESQIVLHIIKAFIYQRDDPIGGDVKIEGSMQLIFKLPMVEDQRSMRTAFFFDFGNVFAMECREYQVVAINQALMN